MSTVEPVGYADTKSNFRWQSFSGLIEFTAMVVISLYPIQAQVYPIYLDITR